VTKKGWYPKSEGAVKRGGRTGEACSIHLERRGNSPEPCLRLGGNSGEAKKAKEAGLTSRRGGEKKKKKSGISLSPHGGEGM